MENKNIEELRNDIENEVENITNRHILILICLYSHKLHKREKERERR